MFRNVYAIVVFLILSGLRATAHAQDAQIQGQVLDTTGAGISKAQVRVVDQQTSREGTAYTNENGQYAVPGLTPGIYKIFVEATGFSTAMSDQITLNPGQSAVMDFTLKVGMTSADVVVTAEKKEEKLNDVPAPVTVLTPNSLADNDQVLLRDYYVNVPGLADTPGFENTQLLAIRGITTGGNTIPTVGVVIDDVPLGSQLGVPVPDLDPGDLAQVEVLRGPQGTFYGANSMGGLIKYVTVDPSTAGFSGRVESGGDGVSNGSEPGYNLRAALNVPVNNKFAIRVSGFGRQDPGYIDSPYLNINGINQINADGGRLSVLWLPTDSLSIKLGAIYQDLRGNGISEVDVEPGLHGLDQDYSGGVGPYQDRTQMYSAAINYLLGGTKLTSITGYALNRYRGTLDFTFLRSYFQQTLGATGDIWKIRNDDSRVTQELRAAGSLGSKLEWQLGGLYTSESNTGYFYMILENSLTRVPIPGPSFWTYDGPGSVFPVDREYAIFGNLSYKATEKLDLQVGLRESIIRQSAGQLVETGLWTSLFEGASSPRITPIPAVNDDALTYLATARYRFDRPLMVYGRVASGYRPGGSNNGNPVPGVPQTYGPDKTENYEVGLKGEFFDQRLTIDGSFYYINWTGIQITRFNSADVIFTTNGAAAKSTGVELSSTLHPWRRMTIDGWVSYDNAVLTQALPNGPTYGAVGDRLPNAAKWSENVSVQQEFPLSDHATAFVGGQVAYQGDRKSVFNGFAADGVTPLPRQDFPAYTRTDIRVGVRYNTWTASLYVNNAGDVRGITGGGVGYFNPQAFIYIQPRTVGATLVRTF